MIILFLLLKSYLIFNITNQFIINEITHQNKEFIEYVHLERTSKIIISINNYIGQYYIINNYTQLK